MCVDAAPATYCTMNRHFCREPSLTVSTDCAKSCEVCNATPAVESSCSDEAPICSLLVNHCGDASQFDYLSKNCAKTCKFCGDTTTPEPGLVVETVLSKVTLRCTTWVSNGFCTNTFYTPELRRQKCSRSCGFCGGPMSNGYTNNYQYTRRTTVNYNAGNGNGVCVDKKAECATQASCNSTNPTYLAWVRDLCPRTCGVC
ncbi:hypothetical protein QR680_013910 [Steinernema hermaphroditum]|uniref:ShKT domain-containing protein n=1 Tax=Steinernema hermaphroditum TaxID=289476 RepID=A0AA39M2C3_9BILA|nr:hypothetical protein QR680_013910 [Steinernema hermaphroditum]